MRSFPRRALAVGALGLLLAAIGSQGGRQGGSALAQGGPATGEILLVYSVGGVLTSDGTLWQYRPDKGSWLTVDEAFEQEGHQTHILPLPVPAAEIAQMNSFGFILTRSGRCWFYDLEKDRWAEIGPPLARR